MADAEPQSSQPKRTNITAYLWVVLAVAGIGLLVWGLRPKPDGATAANRQPAPQFTLPGPDGKIVSLSDFKGKPVFINFWATWCGPCREELPLLAKLRKEHQNDIEFLFISIDDKWDEVNAYLKAEKLDIPVVLDPQGKSVAVGLFNANAWPTTITLDSKHGIVHRVEGSLPEEYARKLIDEALDKTPAGGTTDRR